MSSLSRITGSERAVDDLLGEVRELARRLAGAGPAPHGIRLQWEAPGTLEELKTALSVYRDQVMVRLEWPAVAEAWRLASAGQSRALIELDGEWGRKIPANGAKAAGLQVGRRQLNRLRPLRDARVVQRYLDAIDAGQAHGWHPVVFGVWLAVFGVPLRQGLMHYAEQTLGGLLDSIPVSAAFPETERTRLALELSQDLPKRLTGFLPSFAPALPALPAGA